MSKLEPTNEASAIAEQGGGRATKVEQLIQQYCPDGVEYRPLGELCPSIRTGKLNANEKDEDGLYPFFTCDAKPFLKSHTSPNGLYSTPSGQYC